MEELRAVDGVELALIMHPREPAPERTSRLERRLLAKSAAGRRIDLATIVSGVPTMLCDTGRTQEGGDRDRVVERDHDTIRSHGLTFVLDLGSGLSFDPGVDIAAHGVWSFARNTVDPHQRALACFWRIYRDQPVAAAALLRLPGTVLREGFFRTDTRSCARSADALLYECATWPRHACLDIRSGVPASRDSPAPALEDESLSVPSTLRVLAFLLKVVRNQLLVAWARLFRHPQWNIGVVREPIHRFLERRGQPEIEWSPLATKRGFLSDPFGAVVDGQVTVLYEYFDYRLGRGTINSVGLDDPRDAVDEPVLDSGLHMSYPFILEHEGAIYCIPETSDAREVALHRALDFPRTWEKVATLLDGIAAVDTTVFHHGERWWLTCTDNEANPDANLLVWHAAQLQGPWVAHAANPVKSDVRSARPAGTPFFHAGELYRPAQDCSSTYGGRIVINRVTRLTPQQFAEEPVATIEPSADSPFPHGRHTLAAVGDVTLVDGHRFIFVGAALRHFLRIWGRSLARRFGTGRGRIGP